MARFPTMAKLLAANREGHTLPQQLYVGEEAFRFDTEVMLPSVWLFACTVAHIKKNPATGSCLKWPAIR